jgi:acyl-coenzyme A synthetase/AMP-(fatty) acid ligase
MTTLKSFPLAERSPTEIIAYSGGTAISVAQFLAMVNSVANRLPDGDHVINLCTDRFEYLLGFCAALVVGQVTLMPPNRQQQTVDEMSASYGRCYILDDNNPLARSPVTGAAIEAAVIPDIPADQLSAIAFTSGSTGEPSPNLKFWKTLWHGTSSNRDLLLPQLKNQINLVATVPPQHMWGLETSVLLPLRANIAVSHTTPFYPQDIVDALAELPKPRVLVSSPSHLKTLLKSGIALPDVETVFTATAPLSQELAQQLEDGMHTKVTDIFGCSESGIIAIRRTSTADLWNLAETFQLDAHSDGVTILAPHLPEAIPLPDIVELVADNQFRWLGRQQDMLNIAGKRGSLADLNRRLQAIPGVSDGVILLPKNRSNRLAAMVVAHDLSSSDIRAALRPQVDPVFLPRPIFFVPSLPRQETGKLAGKAIQEMYEEVRQASLKS